MNLFEKEPVQKVIKILNNYNKSIKVISLNTSARTALDAANSLNCDVGAIIKSLLFKTENSFILCLVAGDKRCSLDKLKKIISKKNIYMATPEEVKTQTGYTIGGVSPIGHENTIKIFIDQSLSRFDKIYGAAGHPNCVFNIDFKNLTLITNGLIRDIIE